MIVQIQFSNARFLIQLRKQSLITQEDFLSSYIDYPNHLSLDNT